VLILSSRFLEDAADVLAAEAAAPLKTMASPLRKV
jgi:hypothetical protein